MPHYLKLAGLYLMLAAFSVPAILAETCGPASENADVVQIRSQRSAFNTAISQGDTAGIESVLHENAILITGTNSDVHLGRDAQISLWKEDFARADRAVYVRTGTCIRVSPILPIALESGNWRGVFINDADTFAAGSFAAKWRKLDGAWLVESEIFVTEECGGDLCPEATLD